MTPDAVRAGARVTGELLPPVSRGSTKNSFRDFSGLSTACVEKMRLQARNGALSEANRASLVKASKSPTAPQTRESGPDLSVLTPLEEMEDFKPVFEVNTTGPGRFTVIQRREWSDEYRVRTRVETTHQQPQAPDGPRITSKLSGRGERKIKESCYYMAKCRGGFKTFVTGTFNEESRSRIKSGESTIQKEVSRTMDALQKMYQRGWTDSAGNRHAGHADPLAYCWVVEIPKNAEGADNPHVHLMLGWRVKREQFEDWSQRIEKLWGNGYFHLEKLRKPEAAGDYMAKAAGYMTKAAGESDQGEVKGNRYGISSTARAPDWLTITEAELGVMGQLITDMRDKASDKWGHVYAERATLKKALSATPKQLKQRRHAIGKRLEKMRQLINRIPIVAGKYQTIFKGHDAFFKFMGYAAAAGWDASKRPTQLCIARFREALQRSKEARAISKQRFTDSEWMQAMQDYMAWMNKPEPGDFLAEWDHYAATAQ